MLIRDRLEVPIIASLGQRFHRHGNGIIYFCVKSSLFKLKTTSKVNVMHFLDAICNFFFKSSNTVPINKIKGNKVYFTVLFD